MVVVVRGERKRRGGMAAGAHACEEGHFGRHVDGTMEAGSADGEDGHDHGEEGEDERDDGEGGHRVHARDQVEVVLAGGREGVVHILARSARPIHHEEAHACETKCSVVVWWACGSEADTYRVGSGGRTIRRGPCGPRSGCCRRPAPAPTGRCPGSRRRRPARAGSAAWPTSPRRRCRSLASRRRRSRRPFFESEREGERRREKERREKERRREGRGGGVCCLSRSLSVYLSLQRQRKSYRVVCRWDFFPRQGIRIYRRNSLKILRPFR
jgi:hypothetical protein